MLKGKGGCRILCAVLGLLLVGVATGAAAKGKYQRTVHPYQPPDVVLVNQDGARVDLLDVLDPAKPVLLDFVYATCTTICPVLSAGFSSFQKRMGNAAETAQLVSVTIDPEHDTPELMAKYLKRYRARPGWQFLTGTREDIDKVMRAFDAYVENKMDHYPITFLRGAGQAQWVRIYGLLGTSDLLREYRELQP